MSEAEQTTTEALTIVTAEAMAIVDDMRNQQQQAAASFLAAEQYAAEAIVRQTELGKVLSTVDNNLAKFFGAGSKKQKQQAWTTWYTVELGLDKQEVSSALTRARAVSVRGKKRASTMPVGQLAKLGAVINETAAGSSKKLPLQERRKNASAVIAEAEAAASKEERSLQTADIAAARSKLGIAPPDARGNGSRSKNAASKAVKQLLAVPAEAFATMPEEEWNQLEAWFVNMAQARANQQEAAEEAAA